MVLRFLSTDPTLQPSLAAALDSLEESLSTACMDEGASNAFGAPVDVAEAATDLSAFLGRLHLAAMDFARITAYAEHKYQCSVESLLMPSATTTRANLRTVWCLNSDSCMSNLRGKVLFINTRRTFVGLDRSVATYRQLDDMTPPSKHQSLFRQNVVARSPKKGGYSIVCTNPGVMMERICTDRPKASPQSKDRTEFSLRAQDQATTNRLVFCGYCFYFCQRRDVLNDPPSPLIVGENTHSSRAIVS